MEPVPSIVLFHLLFRVHSYYSPSPFAYLPSADPFRASKTVAVQSEQLTILPSEVSRMSPWLLEASRVLRHTILSRHLGDLMSAAQSLLVSGNGMWRTRT